MKIIKKNKKIWERFLKSVVYINRTLDYVSSNN